MKVLLGPDRKGANMARHPQHVRGGEGGTVGGALPRSVFFSAEGVDMRDLKNGWLTQ